MPSTTTYNVAAFEANKAALFKETESLPSLACRRRFIDAMMVQRELKAASSDFAKRVAPEDAGRLVRDRLFLLKSCIIAGKDTHAEPFLYHLH